MFQFRIVAFSGENVKRGRMMLGRGTPTARDEPIEESMPMQQLMLVTIIAEHVLRERILDDIRKAGANGFTLTEVYGEGTRGIRASTWQGNNVKIETLVAPDVAERIVERLSDTYFEHFAVIVYRTLVDVVRGAKFL
jgi:nitrogen regulatory protein P-II 2